MKKQIILIICVVGAYCNTPLQNLKENLEKGKIEL